jgi:hypothetical protein
LPGLNYDAVSAVVNYVPAREGKPAVGDHPFVTISGTFLRVCVTNKGTEKVAQLRVFCKGSVF